MALSPPGGNTEVKVIVSSDISGLTPGMQEAKQEIKDLATETEATAGKLGKMEQAAGVLRSGVASLAGGFGELAEVALSIAPAVGVAGVGALAAFAIAAKQGHDETERLNKELAMSGNAAGTTVGQLQEIASGAADAANSTRGSVIEAMTQIIAAGGVAADNIGKVSEAAVLLEKFGGQAVKKTASEFAALGEAPVDASIKLNNQYNYLTAAVFEQIKALEEHGRVTEAAKVAQEAYADAVIPRMQELADRAGNVEKAWLGIKSAAKSAWDAMMDVGRGDDGNWEGKLKAAQARAANGGGLFGNQADADLEVSVLQAKVDAEKAATKAARERSDQEKAGIAWAQEAEKYLTKREQKEREIVKAKQLALTAGVSELELAQRLAAIEDKYASKSPAKRTSTDKDQTAVDQLRLESRAADAGLAPQTIKELDALANVQKKTNMEQGEYLRLAGVAMANDPIIAANKRAIALEIKAEAEATQYLNELRGKYDRSNQTKLDSITPLPEGQARRQAELRKVDEQAAESRNRLARAYGTGNLSADDYADKLAELNALVDKQKAAVGDLNDKQDQMNASWEVGATRAMNKYSENARNVATASEQAFTKAFSSMEDALVSFAQTGKLDFKSMADSIISDLIRIQVRAAMSSATSGSSGLGGLFSGLFGGSSSSSSGGYDQVGGNGGSYSDAGAMWNAKGNVFSGSPSLHAYANTVQTTPQTFAFDRVHTFAKGGIFAEAGPEAVMPLARDSSGRLGVMASGAGNSGISSIRVVINNQGSKDQEVKSAEPSFDAEGFVISLIVKDVASDGRVAQTFQKQYGLNRAAGSY